MPFSFCLALNLRLGGHVSQVMKFHTRLAPFQVAIVCSATKSISHLQEVADHVTKELRHAGISALDLRNTTTAAETQFTEYVQGLDPVSMDIVFAEVKNVKF